MIDASHCKKHPHASGAIAGNQDMARTKGSSTQKLTLPWMQLISIRVFSTEDTRADCKEAIRLIENIPAEYLLADRRYDTKEVIKFAKQKGMIVVISPKKNRKEQRFYDKDIYNFVI